MSTTAEIYLWIKRPKSIGRYSGRNLWVSTTAEIYLRVQQSKSIDGYSVQHQSVSTMTEVQQSKSVWVKQPKSVCGYNGWNLLVSKVSITAEICLWVQRPKSVGGYSSRNLSVGTAAEICRWVQRPKSAGEYSGRNLSVDIVTDIYQWVQWLRSIGEYNSRNQSVDTVADICRWIQRPKHKYNNQSTDDNPNLVNNVNINFMIFTSHYVITQLHHYFYVTLRDIFSLNFSNSTMP